VRAGVLARRIPSLRARRIPGFLALLFLGVLAFLVVLALAPAATATVAAASGPWSWPLDGQPSVLRGFEPPTEPWLAGHRGVDLRASPGEPVRAAGAGTVTFAGLVGGVPTVAVTHADGLRTTYQPVLAAVTRDDEVDRGNILGRLSAGGSHCLPRACLHWGLRRGNTYLDPLSLLGTDIQVRLLPIWSDPGSLPSLGAATQLSDRLPTAPPAAHPAPLSTASPARSEVARARALNRARANWWAEVVI
jgi:murein DD-endopeptidase MepM/ murein hydrolase activator NlpD